MDPGFWIPWYWGFPMLAAEVFVLYHVSKFIERKLDEQESKHN